MIADRAPKKTLPGRNWLVQSKAPAEAIAGTG
jgi:hypothetical protein